MCVCVPGVSSRSQVVVAFFQTGSAVVLWERVFALSLSVRCSFSAQQGMHIDNTQGTEIFIRTHTFVPVVFVLPDRAAPRVSRSDPE